MIIFVFTDNINANHSSKSYVEISIYTIEILILKKGSFKVFYGLCQEMLIGNFSCYGTGV